MRRVRISDGSGLTGESAMTNNGDAQTPTTLNVHQRRLNCGILSVQYTPMGAVGAILLSLYLLSPIAFYFLHLRSQVEFNLLAGWNLAVSLIWIVGIHILFRRTVWLHLLLFPLYLTTTADLFLVLNFQARLSSGYIMTAFTDFGDSGEFLRTYRLQICFVLFGLGVLYPVGLWAIRNVQVQTSHRIRACTVAVIALSYLVVIGADTIRCQGKKTLSRACLDVVNHDMSSPFGVIFQSSASLQMYLVTSQHLRERLDYKFDVARSNVKGDEIYILMIGESSRPDHWSINGYDRPTSPNIEKIPGFLTLPDVVSTAPSTRGAVPSMLSLAPVEDWDAVESQRSIVSAFKEAGFETYWLTTQAITPWSGIIYQIAAESDVTRFYDRKLDGVLVDDLAQILSTHKKPAKLFIVLHTTGNHFLYSLRYPQNFAKYPETGATRKETLINTYDNSVLYADDLISQVIKTVETRNSRALVMYVSDHGENLGDDGRRLYGHDIGTQYDLRTAAFIWCSRKLQDDSPEKCAAVKHNAAKKLSITNISPSILDITGTRVAGLDLTMSMFSPTFHEHPRFYRSPQGQLYAYPDVQKAPLAAR